MVVDAYKISPIAYVDWPVPPFTATRVPATVMAPDVAVLGVNPVVPKFNVVTACELKVVGAYVVPPEEYKNCPEVGADGEPVPPWATFNVPPNVMAPVVGVAGVRPVTSPENEVTETPDNDVQLGAALAPPDVNT